MTYFRMGNPHYHRRDFVSRSCSGWEGVVPKRYGRQTLTCMLCRFLSGKAKLEGKSMVVNAYYMMYWCRLSLNECVQSYRIKPHGQLVSVSLTHYCASTPDLSTLWSSTTLQGDRVPREISSQGEFHA